MSRIAGAAFKGLADFARPSPGLSRGLGTVGKVARGAGLEFGSPMSALVSGVPTAMFLGAVGGDLAKGFKESFTSKPFTDEVKQELQRERIRAAQAMKAQRLQRAMADNMMRLAAANPQLYNQLLVGRVLPQGAVVIGGGQKSDFLDSVAYQMATGGFGNGTGTPDSPDIMQALVDSY